MISRVSPGGGGRASKEREEGKLFYKPHLMEGVVTTLFLNNSG